MVLYETHLHTCQASACGKSTGAEHARFYKDIGFAGIIVTDHFFGGNTCVPKDRPWKERVDMFCSGYEDALIQGQKCGLDVFFGWEQGYGDDEYLVYGLNKQWLLNHPEVETWTRREQLEGVHRYGGCVVQAHPFRTRDYIRYVRLGYRYCDGAEVANAANGALNDAYALRYAKHFGLAMTAGSDNHHSFEGLDPQKKIMGIALDQKLGSIDDLVQRILRKQPIGLHVPKERWQVAESETQEIESFFLDEKERLQPTYTDWLALG